MDSLEFEVKAVKKSYTQDKFWPTFPSATLQVAAPSTQGTKAEDDIEIDHIPLPLLSWMEQRKFKSDAEGSSADTTDQSLHQRVFNHFHSSNCMVGPGDVYGGDFVLYKNGSPAQTHSIATVLVHDSHIIPVKDVLGLGRVNNQVAKSAVIAFDNPNKPGDSKEDYVIFNFRRVSARV